MSQTSWDLLNCLFLTTLHLLLSRGPGIFLSLLPGLLRSFCLSPLTLQAHRAAPCVSCILWEVQLTPFICPCSPGALHTAIATCCPGSKSPLKVTLPSLPSFWGKPVWPLLPQFMSPAYF